MIRVFILLALAASSFPLRAQPSWQEEFAKMPLVEKPAELERRNCVRILLNSFQSNAAVKALIFMPGATDEFYFFRRADARLTNDSPTLLDAVIALTNQTYIRATFSPPFLLLHTAEDPLDPITTVEDEKTADRIKRKHFKKHVLYNDVSWDDVQPSLEFDLNIRITPRPGSRESWHFFRSSFSEFGLDGWDALRAFELAGKTKAIIKKRVIVMEGDARYRGKPADLHDFLLKPKP